MSVNREVNQDSSSPETNENATISDMGDQGRGARDGDVLQELLGRNGRRPADLQRALGRSRQQIYNYLKFDKFSPEIRDIVRRGLESLGIDSTPLAETTADAITDPTELRHLLNGIPDDALPNLRRMLEIRDRVTRVALMALIEDRIERSR